MKTFAINVALLSVMGLASAPALASGFRCESQDGYRVQVYNHVHADKGTRVPAVLVVSHRKGGTLLAAKSSEISKRNLAEVVQYSARGKNGLDYAIVQIAFKEGRDYLAEGEVVPGTLILGADSERQVSRLVCARYKKQ